MIYCTVQALRFSFLDKGRETFERPEEMPFLSVNQLVFILYPNLKHLNTMGAFLSEFVLQSGSQLNKTEQSCTVKVKQFKKK